MSVLLLIWSFPENHLISALCSLIVLLTFLYNCSESRIVSFANVVLVRTLFPSEYWERLLFGDNISTQPSQLGILLSDVEMIPWHTIILTVDIISVLCKSVDWQSLTAWKGWGGPLLLHLYDCYSETVSQAIVAPTFCVTAIFKVEYIDLLMNHVDHYDFISFFRIQFYYSKPWFWQISMCTEERWGGGRILYLKGKEHTSAHTHTHTEKKALALAYLS